MTLCVWSSDQSCQATMISVGLVTVSDRCFSGETVDSSGENLKSILTSGELFAAIVKELVVVPDDFQKIQTAVSRLCDLCDLVLTCGGTGVSPRDLTPEAVTPLLDRTLPSLATAILVQVLPSAALAPLSRSVAGVRAKTLVLTLPGSLRGSEQCLRAAASCLPHAIDVLQSRMASVTRQHAANAAKSLSPPQISAAKSKVVVDAVSKRSRDSPYAAVSVLEATDAVMTRVRQMPRQSTQVHVLECEGMVLYEDVCASVSLPPFDASIKDGYAVRSSDDSLERRVVAVSVAGSAPATCNEVSPLAENCCVRVSTGAPIPRGADAVVMVEDTRVLHEQDGEEHVIQLLKRPEAGRDIRGEGSDFRHGDVICKLSTRITGMELAALAAGGVRHVSVFRRPLVALLSTGDELIQAGDAPVPGRVYDANRPCLAALAKSCGARIWSGWQHCSVPDQPDSLLAALSEALSECDVVVTTGSASMGERDLLKRVLVEDLSAEIHFGRVHVKPGLPTTFASLCFNGDRKLVFCLPGNPVSAAVCFSLFVQPAIDVLCGSASSLSDRQVGVKYCGKELLLDTRPEYVRASLAVDESGARVATLTNGNRRSSNVTSLVGATALLQLPARSSHKLCLYSGDTVPAILL